MKIQKKFFFGGGGGGGGGFRVVGVRVDVNEELKFFCENSSWGGGSGWM